MIQFHSLNNKKKKKMYQNEFQKCKEKNLKINAKNNNNDITNQNVTII
jgi:hypothetical protein